VTARQKPDSCASCQCFSHGTDFSRVEGTGANGVMLVGEASGECEAREQTPFVKYAPAGSLLERTFRRMGVDRQQFSITNIIRCRPRNNWLEGAPWEYSAINSCRPNLNSTLAERHPRAIVALGGTALRELTGLAGEKLGISYLAGYVLPGPNNIPVVANFHPAFLRRGKASHQGIFARILQRGINIAAGRDHAWTWHLDPDDPLTYGGLRYATHPSLDDARAFASHVLDNGSAMVAYDIETSESASLDEDAREGFQDTQLQLVQFCMESGQAIALPWEGGYREIAQSILLGPNPKCGQNVWTFDNKVLRAVGEREGMDLAPRGVIHDTLQMFHHWQPDLPAHLQFCASFISYPFPWKHLAASNIEFYGCTDVDATLRIYNFLEATLKKDGLWGDATLGYLGQVYHVRPILAAMEDRGMPIDNSARVALGKEFEDAQTLLHIQICNMAGGIGRVHPKQGYKGIPPEVKKEMEEIPCRDALIRGMPGYEDNGEWYHYERRLFDVPDVDVATGAPVAIATTRWCRVYDFNPNSKDQVIAYMKAKGHKVPKSKEENEDGSQKDTTEEKELRRLAIRTGDQFYLKVVEYRGFTKLRSTYIDGFEPGSDGCVHTTFTFAPAIGQLSSRNPNIQNFTKLKPTVVLAKAMRRMVAAKPGHILTEWDFKSCHIITLGFLAEDLNYMRLGRLDMHSFVAGHFLKLWDGFKIFSESDDELRARFKWLKSDPDRKRVRDDQAKHGILGIGNGLRAKGLYERYMESFPPVACRGCAGTGRVSGARGSKMCPACHGTAQTSGQRVAEEVLDVAQALFPRVFEFQERQRKEAHERQVLHTPFGYARRFYEVYRWDGKRNAWGHGDQAEEAVAYRLANIAFGHIREKLKELHAAGLDSKYGLFNNIHDSFLFNLPDTLLDEHIREVYPILTSPSKVLRHPTICPDGLVIDVEGAWGKNWSDMKEIDVHSHTTQEVA
jgi:uracil-DNA glycosylase family 4